jgi:hypothetical protein
MIRCVVLIGLMAAVSVPPGPLKAGHTDTALQPVPAEVLRRAEKSRLSGTIAAWCQGEFRSGRPGDIAAAVTGAGSDGRYVVLDVEGNVTELAPFSGKPDLSCYSRAGALELGRALARSETIAGRIAPRWNTTVICGFLENTSASCWQYSPTARAFVQVGSWTT